MTIQLANPAQCRPKPEYDDLLFGKHFTGTFLIFSMKSCFFAKKISAYLLKLFQSDKKITDAFLSFRSHAEN
jgi:hypothetical protein